jgi:hypothetical protein
MAMTHQHNLMDNTMKLFLREQQVWTSDSRIYEFRHCWLTRPLALEPRLGPVEVNTDTIYDIHPCLLALW